MFTKLFKKDSVNGIPHQIYGSLMTQSRNTVLYRDFGVPDTVMGRFDMLALHVYLVARRLRKQSDERFQNLNQDVFDLFVADIERALRELGIGDTTVPKRKKKMVRSFYGQIEDFDASLEAGNLADLSKAVGKRYLNEAESGDSRALTDYIISVEQILGTQSAEELLKGNISFQA